MTEPWAVVIAAIIGALFGSLLTKAFEYLTVGRWTRNVVEAQLKYTLSKAQRFRQGGLDPKAFAAGQPLFKGGQAWVSLI